MVNVTAVRTTGIYCRAGCPAKPLERNTEQYRSQVAAEVNGFRPCLRCRPDREPGLDLDADAPLPLRRALAAISAGALDDGDEAELAAGVGYSERHLRRLFVEQIGATPAEVARSRRAHFARRLLDDSNLSITDIAFAAGFNSVRQMHRVMRQTFGFPPSDLRKWRKGAPDAVDGGLALSLAAPGLDWPSTLAHLAPRATPGVEAVTGDRYGRTFELCGNVGVLELGQSRPDRLDVVLHLPDYGGVIDLVHRIRRLVGLDLPAAAEIEAICEDELLGPLATDHGDVRIPGAWDPFETLIRVILGQQVSVVGASTTAGRVVAAATPQIDGLDRLGLSHRFPNAVELAAADLSDCGLTTRRHDTLLGVAAAVASGTVDLAAPADELRAALCELPGIGPWTAELCAMRISRDLDAFPGSDLGLRDGVGQLTGSGRASADEVHDVAARWAPFRAMAATLLWSTGSVASTARAALAG